jgi:hypothetical protein
MDFRDAVGHTALQLFFLMISIFIAEKLHFMQIYIIAYEIAEQPLDVWLIVILIVFSPPLFIMNLIRGTKGNAETDPRSCNGC